MRNSEDMIVTVVAHPAQGTIVRVDLTGGFRPPEMIKRRPCVILSPELQGRGMLAAIVPLSTTPPTEVMPWHALLSFDPPLPAPYDRPQMWLKADIVLTVAFHRLRLLHVGKDDGGPRVYDVRVLSPGDFARVQACVKAGLGL